VVGCGEGVSLSHGGRGLGIFFPFWTSKWPVSVHCGTPVGMHPPPPPASATGVSIRTCLLMLLLNLRNEIILLKFAVGGDAF